MEWHPHAESYPLLEGEEFESFNRDIAEGQKLPILYRIRNRKRQGLDGRNRERTCKALGIKPKYKQVVVRDEDCEKFIDSHNLHRRHLTAD